MTSTYWNCDKAGGLPGFLSTAYPTIHAVEFGDESIVRVDVIGLALVLYDSPNQGGVPIAAKPLPFDTPLRQAVHDMVELHFTEG